MLTKFGFKGKIRKRLIETATEEEFWELLKEEEVCHQRRCRLSTKPKPES